MHKNIAIVAGGDSSEYEVSLNSAKGLMGFIPDDYHKEVLLIRGKEWNVLRGEEKLPVDRNDFSFVDPEKGKVVFDYAYITIHGTPGENGIFEGYLRLMGIPFSTCDVLPSAMTFNKFACNNFLRSFGLNVAKSIVVRSGERVETAKVVEELGLPVFVKPSVGGSSYGVTKVKRAEDLQEAIKKAFAEGEEVLIEAFMEGIELTNGMYRTKTKECVFPVTEIATKNEFFDYEAKYLGKVDEITPARISDELAKRIQETTRKIYGLLGAHGIIRVDYIVGKGDVIKFLEVNTTPGMTTASIIPNALEKVGIDIREVMRDIIEDR
ncbi:MAG: D-alanine--D-alanine ligase [Paludibacteraceae bacterium]|nr:D-alanine--D-alanine ligase [Paludibacteraceae bacterium]